MTTPTRIELPRANTTPKNTPGNESELRQFGELLDKFFGKVAI